MAADIASLFPQDETSRTFYFTEEKLPEHPYFARNAPRTSKFLLRNSLCILSCRQSLMYGRYHTRIGFLHVPTPPQVSSGTFLAPGQASRTSLFRKSLLSLLVRWKTVRVRRPKFTCSHARTPPLTPPIKKRTLYICFAQPGYLSYTKNSFLSVSSDKRPSSYAVTPNQVWLCSSLVEQGRRTLRPFGGRLSVLELFVTKH